MDIAYIISSTFHETEISSCNHFLFLTYETLTPSHMLLPAQINEMQL